MLELLFGAGFLAVLAWIAGRPSRLRLWIRLELFAALSALFIGAMYVLAKRVEGGLGAVTNLSDRVPWGLWITFDLCGVALASGGFLVAATVHVLHLKRFEPILRPTVLTALIAYQLVAAVLVLDLGRPQRFWHPLIMWQHHSVMFEITLCLTLYTAVLLLEFSPALLERLGRHELAEALHRLAGPLVIVGVILSTLHQSSFGSLFLIVPGKLHPYWYTPLLPVMFLASAACAGLAVVIAESRLCATLLRRQLPDALLLDLGRACRWAAWGYLALKLGDLAWRRPWTRGSTPAWLTASLIIELLAGAVLPALWFGRATRRGEVRGLIPRPAVGPKGPAPCAEPPSAAPAGRGMMPASLLVIGGVVLNRVNISWFGLVPFAGVWYVPHWMEVLIVLALGAGGVVAFVALTTILPVFPAESGGEARSPSTCGTS